MLLWWLCPRGPLYIDRHKKRAFLCVFDMRLFQIMWLRDRVGGGLDQAFCRVGSGRLQTRWYGALSENIRDIVGKAQMVLYATLGYLISFTM